MAIKNIESVLHDNTGDIGILSKHIVARRKGWAQGKFTGRYVPEKQGRDMRKLLNGLSNACALSIHRCKQHVYEDAEPTEGDVYGQYELDCDQHMAYMD